MGFFSRLFGQKESQVSQSVEPTQYKGFLIYPESIAEQGQYRVAGRLCKEIDGELKTHHFIRSDLLGSEQSANELMVQKAKMCIDQQAQDLFKD
ncbi:MAG: HlyU family transcriptional regulator [Vibrio sp.]